MRDHPFIYQVNTWVWLDELRRRTGTSLDLASVPEQEWDAIQRLGFDAVWLMGVWERSPAGIAIALENEGLTASFRDALPDLRAEDIVGSPYCIRSYTVDPHLGGPAGLATARAALAERGLALILDFVPNHVAPDHPWTTTNPEYFVPGDEDDLAREPASFVRVGDAILAKGRDPYFPAWPDVVQLNAFSPDQRTAAIATLKAIAAQSDGVRCDMAMLMMSDTFARTWGARAGPQPDTDYWPAVIPAVRQDHPDFLFMAEAYWDLEWALQQQGFDYCYDKRLYDRLVQGDAEGVRGHLTADQGYQSRLVRFIENHDEPRAAATFPTDKARAAAVTALSQTGARIVHEGQLDGRTVHVPVFLGRRPDEPPDRELRAFYEQLLAALADAGVPRRGVAPRRRPAAGRGTTRGRSSSAGAGAARPGASWWSTSATNRRPATCRCRWDELRGQHLASSPTRPPARSTSEAGTTSATGSTSLSARGHGTSSP